MKQERFFAIPRKSDNDTGCDSEEQARKAAQIWVRMKNEPCYVVKVLTLYIPTVVEITEELENK